VTHRKGIHHIDADAVSRLLEVPFVRTANKLFDDKEPLTEAELLYIRREYGNKDAEFIIPILEEGRMSSEPKKLGQLRAKKGIKAVVTSAKAIQDREEALKQNRIVCVEMLEKEVQNEFDVTEFEQYIDNLLEIRRSHDLEGDRRIEEIRKLFKHKGWLI
jgi:hypothetical protein